MKNLHLKLVPLGIVLLVAGCGGGGSSSSGGGGGTPTAAVKITSSNAPAVAKGAVAPSQTMAKQGASGAALAVVVQAAPSRHSVVEIALAQLRRVESLSAPLAPASVAGVIPGFANAIAISCSSGTQVGVGTSNSYSLAITDTNNNAKIDLGDVFTLNYKSCVQGTETTNGGISLTINSLSGGVYNASSGYTDGTAGSPKHESITMSFSSFTVVNTAPVDSSSMDGNMTLGVVDNGTLMSTTISGTTFSTTSTTDGAFTMKDYSIVYTEDSPTATTSTGHYSYTIGMTTNCAALGGDIVITTPTAIAGNATGYPTGQMLITGKDGGTLTLTAQSNGTVTMVLDEDGAGPLAPQTLAPTTWAAL